MNTKIIESQKDLDIAFLDAIKTVQEPEFRVISADRRSAKPDSSLVLITSEAESRDRIFMRLR